MVRLASVVGMCILGLAFVVSTGLTQDKGKDGKKDKELPKTKGQLPPGWKDNLKLTKDQIQEIYAVQAKFKAKIQALEDQIKSMKAAERAEMVKVLSDEQKDLLRKLVIGEEDKKEAAKKSDDKEKKDKDK